MGKKRATTTAASALLPSVGVSIVSEAEAAAIFSDRPSLDAAVASLTVSNQDFESPDFRSKRLELACPGAALESCSESSAVESGEG